MQDEAVGGAGRVRRNPEKTRRQILAAAYGEFAARGLEGARVDAIAERSGANKRMIYHYFGSKDGLFLAVLETAYEEIRSRERELDLAGRDPAAAIRELVTFTFRYFREKPEFLHLLNNENLYGAAHLKQSADPNQRPAAEHRGGLSIEFV